MTYTTQLTRDATPRTGLAKLWADLRRTFRTSSEAFVRVAYDKPWLRDSGYQG